MRTLATVTAATVLCAVVALGALASAQTHSGHGGTAIPDTVALPDFRKWVYIGGGLFSSADGPNTRFSNVFVEPSAYDAYMQTGQWPDRTIVYSDKRAAITTLPITANAGLGQTGDSVAAELEIKDQANDRWLYYQAARGASVAKAVADQSACTTCHLAHAKGDSVFVQFYPALARQQ